MKTFIKNNPEEEQNSTGFKDAPPFHLSKGLIYLMILALLHLTGGCYYFKVRTDAPSAVTLTGLKNAGKTIIVHFGENKWQLTNAVVIDNNLTGTFKPYVQLPTLKPLNVHGSNRYKVKNNNPVYDQRYLLNEVHLHLLEYADHGQDKVTIPINTIDRIEIYDKDKGATTASWILSSVGVAAGAFTVVAVIVALTKESCPFIYVWDGESYQFVGEIYSGSIHQPLERNDYLKLPSRPGNKTCSLKIANEVREIQHTNLMELLVVDHPEKSQVLVDKYGTVTLLNQLNPPTRAIALSGGEITDLVASRDNSSFQGTFPGSQAPLHEGIIMEFPGKGNSQSAKLAIRAKNSILLDYMIGQFHDLFGAAYHSYMKKQEKGSPEQMRNWTHQQGITLALSVERSGQWEFVDYYNIAGPMAFKEDVLSFPLTGNESDPLRVKLEFGNLLWEIDYTAIDFSEAEPVHSFMVPISSAVTDDRKEISDLLREDDHRYYDQPEYMDQAIVTFDLPEPVQPNRSIFLHTKGWYQVIRDPQGKPQTELLKSFRDPGQFTRFMIDHLTKLGERAAQPQ